METTQWKKTASASVWVAVYCGWQLSVRRTVFGWRWSAEQNWRHESAIAATKQAAMAAAVAEVNAIASQRID